METMPTFVEKPMHDEWSVHCIKRSHTGSRALHLFSYRSKTKPQGLIYWDGDVYQVIKAEKAGSK